MKTIVEIEWDEPQEQHWLCPDNVAIALHAYCVNTKFNVKQLYEETIIKSDLKDALLALQRTLGGPGAIPGHSDECWTQSGEPSKFNNVIVAKKAASCICGLSDAAKTYNTLVQKYFR